MAPIRPRAPAPPVGGKKVNRKPRPFREPSDSWELLERQGLALNGGHEEEDSDNEEEAHMLQDSVDIDTAMDPLREMAERVGREVETFAETLDQFFTDLPVVSSRFDAAHDLVLQFRDIASDAATELKENHERETRQLLRKEWSEQSHISSASTSLQPFTSSGSTALTAKKAEQVRQLRQWQQEADVWELFRVMLELHPFEADAQAMRADKEEKLARLGTPHRYTSEGDLWERFLLEDDLARERSMIKTWLEQTVDHQASDVQSIVEELETKAGRGKGLWSSGWIHTREKIKGEKRLRTWPNAADSPLPQIRRSDNNELLVSTLDPDAPHRQKRTLEKPDTYFERAIWVACWEMLRRGKSLQDICDWCEERKEGWRAVVMGGAVDPSESTASSQAWKHMCLLASQSGYATDYEAAVLGYIGGNVKSMENVSRTIDDHLYAHYSAALTRQFDQYLLSVCPEQALPSAWRRGISNDALFNPEQAQQDIGDLISRLRKDASTSTESAQPMKIIQAFLLADEVGSLIHTVGAAIAETASLQGPEDMIYLRDRERLDGQPRGEVEVALNMQTLRITAHMAILHRILSPDYLEGDELLEDENVLVAYIQALRAAGKRLLIPLYAAKLQRQRCIIVLGRILQDVTDSQEQTHMLRLLQELDLDVVSILQEQLAWILDSSFDTEYAEMPLPMLEPTADEKMYPGQRIKVDFLPDVVVKSDEAVVRALQMFQLLPGGWEVTFRALTYALRKCLVTGRFVCARMIIENFPYAEVSLSKSYETIGRAVNIIDPASLPPTSEEEALAIELMKRQSRTYHELSLLVRAVEVLSTWRSEEHKYVEKAPKPNGVPPILKRAKAAVSEAMEPLLLQGILLDPVDEAEAADLTHIRLTYLPEVVMAFVTVLHTAGNVITREALLESMDLGVGIADEKGIMAGGEEEEVGEGRGNGLVECFVRAGRMRELMRAFALTSKLMLVLKAEGRPWRPRRDRVQRDLGIWELGSTDVEAA